MKQIKSLIVIMLLFSGLFIGIVPENVTAFSKEVNDFDRIWYHPTIGFNKNGDGSLIMAVTYKNNSLRNIDYASFTYTSDPFYLRIAFTDELTIERDAEGNIIYQEPSDGYVYLKKQVIDNNLPEDIKRLASQGFTYKTITYDGDQWYRISVPNFNRVYEWKEYSEPIPNEKWYTWGSDESISFNTKAMFVELQSEEPEHLLFDLSHPSDNSGQTIAINKSYLSSKEINNPCFEWKDDTLWVRIGYTENNDYYFITPNHFSEIGIHEVADGYTNGTIQYGAHTDSTIHTITSAIDSYVQEQHPTTNYGSEVDITAQNVQAGNDCEALLRFDVSSIPSEAIITQATVRLYNRYLLSTPNVHFHRVTSSWTEGAVTWNTKPSYDATATNSVIVDTEDTYDYWDVIVDVQDFVDGTYTNYGWDILISESPTTQTAIFHSSEQTYNPRLTVKYEIRFNVTRDVAVFTEQDNLSFVAVSTYTTVTLKVPVSTSVQGIINVTNITDDELATEVNISDELINNTFWYDSANQFVHIRTTDIPISSTVEWMINCSYGATFNLVVPSYLEVGQYFFSEGLILDSNDDALSGVIAETRLLYANGTDALPVNPKWNCTGGNYQCVFSTNALISGTYSVSIEFTDSESGVTFKEGFTLYLSVDPGTGVYVSTFLHFTFYNNNTGIGIPSESFKVYASTDTTIDYTDRIYVNLFGVYTGQTIYYRINDYFDNQVYPFSGSYKTLAITSVEQFEDVPIDWHSFSVKNMNHSIVHFKMTNVSTTYSQYLYPYEPFYWDVLGGEYTINLTYYDPETDVIESYSEENITISNDTYYWIRGYDLQDIILEIRFTNTTVDNLEITITSDISFVNSTVNTITSDISTNIGLFESNITTINNNVWNAINITDSIVSYVNSTIWNELNYINNNISWMNSTTTYVNDTIWNNFTIVGEDITILNISIHNAIDLSELNLTALNINIWNDFNLTDAIIGYLNNTIWNEIDMVNVTIDHMNNTIWTNLSLIDSDIDTLSVLVNTNIELSETNVSTMIYNVWTSLNLTNVTINHLNATIWNEIDIINSNLNYTNLTITNMILLTENNITSLIITIDNIIDYALMPDIEIVTLNPPMVFSTYDKEGMAIGVNIYKICPALITIATTRVESTGNWINSTAKIPGNDTVTNGTVTILSDDLYISGSNAINWVNITYTDNGTLYQNTTYIPGKINLYGQNLTINASGDIHILRETQYNQLKKFYWTYYSTTGKHTAGIDIINDMNVPLYDVYNYVEFSNQSTPDPTTIIMRDVSNAGVVLKAGEHYDVTGVGIHFYLLSIDSDSTRGFTFEYYKRFDDAYNYGEAQTAVDGYVGTTWNGLSFNTFPVGWTNPENTIFRGGLYVKLDFDDSSDIDSSSMRIWDETNNQELSSSDFIVGSGFIRIGADGLGDVNPGSGRSFSVYFLLSEYPGSDPTEIHLNTQLWSFHGFAFTPFFFIFLIGLILIGYSVYAFMYKKKSWDVCKNGIVLGVFIIFIFYILAYMGI